MHDPCVEVRGQLAGVSQFAPVTMLVPGTELSLAKGLYWMSHLTGPRGETHEGQGL